MEVWPEERAGHARNQTAGKTNAEGGARISGKKGA